MIHLPDRPRTSATIAQSLAGRRHHVFVGRTSELAELQAAIEDRWPFHVLYVHGAAGIGKTALLHEYARLCRRAGLRVRYLDAGQVEPRPELVECALAALPWRSPLAQLGDLEEIDGRSVLLLDRFDTWALLERWFLRSFLPRLPATCLVILFARRPPSRLWLDGAWSGLLRRRRLGPLARSESTCLLAARGVPEELRPRILHFAGDHPLALVMAGQATAGAPLLGGVPPRLARHLLAELLDGEQAPDTAVKRSALEILALARVTDEHLLERLLGAGEDAAAAFGWLQRLSLVVECDAGLYPMRALREAAAADLRWRNSSRHDELRRGLLRLVGQQLRQLSPGEWQAPLLDLLHLVRGSSAAAPLARPMVWTECPRVVPAGPADVEPALAMIARHDGEAAAELVRRWLELPFATLFVCRAPGNAAGEPEGILLTGLLEHPFSAPLLADPVLNAVLRHARDRAGVSPGERVLLARTVCARDTGHEPSATTSALVLELLHQTIAIPRLALTAAAIATPESWLPFVRAINPHTFELSGCRVGERDIGVVGQDWRQLRPVDALMEISQGPLWAASDARVDVSAQLQAGPMSFDEVLQAVREALRSIDSLDALEGNRLLHARSVSARVPPGAAEKERSAALRELLLETVESLRRSPRTEKCYRALLRAYVDPAPTQEYAAELLGLPHSTFRRHLKLGIERVTRAFWRAELGRPA